MSLIDRILNGDFDDKDDVSIPAIKTHNHRGSKGTCSPARSADPNEDEELVTDEEEEFEDLPSEDIDDKDSTVIMEESSDIPSGYYQLSGSCACNSTRAAT